MSSIPKGKQLAEIYFSRDEPKGIVWTCSCGAKRKQSGSGYTNLVSHITSEHPEHVQLGKETKKTTSIL
jgi:hypothetical protein